MSSMSGTATATATSTTGCCCCCCCCCAVVQQLLPSPPSLLLFVARVAIIADGAVNFKADIEENVCRMRCADSINDEASSLFSCFRRNGDNKDDVDDDNDGNEWNENENRRSGTAMDTL
jgi:hypothetical protein